MTAGPLGPRNPEVKRLRELLHDRAARAEARAVVLEGPRAIDAALARAVRPEALYVAPRAEPAFAVLVDRVRAAGTRVVELKEGVLERIGTTVTPQPVLAVAPAPAAATLPTLASDRPVLVLVDVADPGNAGTLLRSAEAAGAAGVVCCGDTVDVHSPKVARASAGAIFGVPLVVEGDPVPVLDALGAHERRRYGTAARGGEPPARLDLSGGPVVVVGNEAHGLPSQLTGRLDGCITIPMGGAAESLNVAVAGSVVLFEAARQRALTGDASR